MKQTLVLALLLPLVAGQANGFTFSSGFIIEAADKPAECECYPCLCQNCKCDGGPCECKDGSACSCPCNCPCEKGKPCTCGQDCKCKKCPGKHGSSVEYESLRQAALDGKRNFYVWIGCKRENTAIYTNLGYHAVKPNGWQGIQGPAYVVSEYYEENGVGKLWWREVVDLRPTQRYAIPTRC